MNASAVCHAVAPSWRVRYRARPRVHRPFDQERGQNHERRQPELRVALERRQRERGVDLGGASFSRAGLRVPERGQEQADRAEHEADAEVGVRRGHEPADRRAGDPADRVRRVQPLQDRPVRDRLNALPLDVQEDVDQSVPDAGGREGEPQRAGRQERHPERAHAEGDQTDRAECAEGERCEARRDERHHEHRDDRQEREHRAHLPVAEVVLALELDHEDHPDAPVLTERPVPGEQRRDPSPFEVRVGRYGRVSRAWRRPASHAAVPPDTGGWPMGDGGGSTPIGSKQGHSSSATYRPVPGRGISRNRAHTAGIFTTVKPAYVRP